MAFSINDHMSYKLHSHLIAILENLLELPDQCEVVTLAVTDKDLLHRVVS